MFKTALAGLKKRLALPPEDLLRDRVYRRLWTSILISSLGGQITLLALPLTAAVLLHASPTQMGLLTAMEIAPFVLFSLPGGVWLDRVRKLPVYVAGELSMGAVAADRAHRPLDGLAEHGLALWRGVCAGPLATPLLAPPRRSC